MFRFGRTTRGVLVVRHGWNSLCGNLAVLAGLGRTHLGDPFQPRRQVPIAVSEQLHRSWEKHRADDCGVDKNRDSQPHAELLHVNLTPEGKGAEDPHHDGDSAGYLTRGQPDYHRRLTRRSRGP